MIGVPAPKAGALPDCATPRRADALRLRAGQRASGNPVGGVKWQNVAGTGNANPGIVPEDVLALFPLFPPRSVRGTMLVGGQFLVRETDATRIGLGEE